MEIIVLSWGIALIFLCLDSLKVDRESMQQGKCSIKRYAARQVQSKKACSKEDGKKFWPCSKVPGKSFFIRG
jgi:hypothetical protein